MEIQNTPVLLTGCSTGIGYTCAQALKALGYDVYITARKPADILRLKQEGFNVHFMDYAISQSIDDCLAWVTEATHNRLYGVFNNGAYGQPGAVEDLSREHLRDQFESNVFGWQELTNKVLPGMRERGQGRIVHNSSVLGFIALKYRGAYNASKFAIEGLTHTLRLELAGSGVHVSLIQPGPIESNFRHNAYQKFRENIDTSCSAHADHYKTVESRLQSSDSKGDPFTLPASSIVPKLRHAFESTHPKVRYPVTFPTHLFRVLNNFLPYKVLDKILGSID